MGLVPSIEVSLNKNAGLNKLMLFLKHLSVYFCVCTQTGLSRIQVFVYMSVFVRARKHVSVCMRMQAFCYISEEVQSMCAVRHGVGYYGFFPVMHCWIQRLFYRWTYRGSQYSYAYRGEGKTEWGRESISGLVHALFSCSILSHSFTRGASQWQPQLSTVDYWVSVSVFFKGR